MTFLLTFLLARAWKKIVCMMHVMCTCLRDRRDPPLCQQPHIVLRPLLLRDALLGGQSPHLRGHHEAAAAGATGRIARAAVARDRRGIALGSARDGHRRTATVST